MHVHECIEYCGGENMKMFLMGMILCCAGTAGAAVNCTGVPQAAKVGEYGNQEGYLIATVNNLDFRLGLATNDQVAKSRLTLAMMAMASNKALLIKFWDYTDCAAASAAGANPNSVQLVQ